VVAASFLGWTLDAFDFFLIVFVLKDIAQEFHTDVTMWEPVYAPYRRLRKSSSGP